MSSSPIDKSFWSSVKNISKICQLTSPLYSALLTIQLPLSLSPTDKATLFQCFSAYYTLDDSDIPSPPNLPFTRPLTLPVFPYCKVQYYSFPVSRSIPPNLRLCLLVYFAFASRPTSFPSPLKNVLVQPLPNKGDHSDPSDNLPMAVNFTICKCENFLILTFSSPSISQTSF